MRFCENHGGVLKLMACSRVRGYQFKAEGPGEPKKNAVAFQHAMNDGELRLAEATPPSGDFAAEDLEEKGFAEKEDA